MLVISFKPFSGYKFSDHKYLYKYKHPIKGSLQTSMGHKIILLFSRSLLRKISQETDHHLKIQSRPAEDSEHLEGNTNPKRHFEKMALDQVESTHTFSKPLPKPYPQ